MCFASFLTRPTLWIALAAILWASLAPSLAHALSLSPGGHHAHRISVDYCASEGEAPSTLTLEVQHDGSDDTQADAHGDGHHCPLCRNPQADVGILPAPVPVVPAPVGRAITYPPLFFLAANPLHAWSAAQPRAPPAN
ncbi:hypothetical protein G6F22_016165 [Rhizopus arrhizus]|jgi:hypothetical protein|uniref:DUF2946 domain-containing protein n=1 Tax=Achromobacter marplatensis TaxID=470868 RepID=UPI0028E872FB|nr:DUF2946 domain-containing protein [uncultured Achromobacter sp.]KAG0771830.1 hypothetical protein G6F22_016165 [Rhizopus arrhizus]KAG0941986.1 hypothetical protein G6F31_014937 [Rhizopus arrhizus]KAG1258592.1 hypothetical protein G6F65_015524 [Rhizopus arrhizus]